MAQARAHELTEHTQDDDDDDDDYSFSRLGFSVALEPVLELEQAGLELTEIHLPLPPECRD